LLDQHGSGGDHDPGRLHPPPGRGCVGLSRVAATVLDRVHALLLGDRDLVDSAPAHPRSLAARSAALPAALRPAVLGNGLPSRDVRGLHVPARPSGGTPRAPGDPALLSLSGARGLARRIRGDDRESGPIHPAANAALSPDQEAVARSSSAKSTAPCLIRSGAGIRSSIISPSIAAMSRARFIPATAAIRPSRT